MMAARLDLPDHAGEVRRALDGIGARVLLERLGLTKGATRQARGLVVRCPVHPDGTPSCSVQDTDRGIVWKCHGCQAAGDALALVAAVRGLDLRGPRFVETLREAASLAGLRHVLDELDEQERAKGRPVTPRPVRVAAPSPPVAIPPRSPIPTPSYPDRAEVAALWGACVSVLDDDEAAAVLRARGLSPEAVELHDLARVLPEGYPLPRWARSREGSWHDSRHRLLLPVFDEHGELRSLRAWRMNNERPKRLPPAGHKAGGLVLANALGRMMLETGARPSWWPDGHPFDVVITEGEPDLIARACWYSDADELAPAVLGIAGSGGWSQAIADRIPNGARVFIRTDLDERGDDYAREVARTIGERCPLLRQRKDALT